jgi:predicted ATP-grasp superfamily ATP-dependent carboligase
MLDKLDTYRAARSAGVPTPKFWEIESAEQLEAVRSELVFPVLIKPRLSHLFERRFGRKHVIVDTMEQLDAAIDACRTEHVEVLLMEWIPGGDDALCSYFTYLDSDSRPLLHFTKRIIRRFPSGMGGACAHRIDWIPALIEPANQLFRAVGLRGLANVEFKRDPRDGTYKLIECNARFVASNCLVTAGGVNLAAFVYSRLTGASLGAAPKAGPHKPLRLWDPGKDWMAYRERARLGELSFVGWLKTIARPQRFQFFAWTDPLPAWARATRPIWKRWLKKPPVPAATVEPVAPAPVPAPVAEGSAVG